MTDPRDEALFESLPAEALSPLTGSATGSFDLVGRLEGGTSGAWRVRHSSGAELVIKTAPVAAAEHYRLLCERVDRLRDVGYPAPRHVLCGVGDVLVLAQELLPGAADPQITPRLANQLLALGHRASGLGASDPSASTASTEFRHRIRRSLLTGLDGYCEHASLEAHSDATRAILQRSRRLGAALDADQLPADDLIHGDFHTANLLALDDSLSGVVDWESVTVGDWLFDLARLTFTAMRRPDAEALRQLWAPLLDPAVRFRAEAYTAHTAIIVIDWRLTRREPGAADYAIRAATAAFASFDQGAFVGFDHGE